jgi:hypothetical protein
VNDGKGQEKANVPGNDDFDQPARKRGREAVTGARQASTKKLTGKVVPQARENDEPQVAVGPLCVGHKSGEIWESGNMRFKVGTDGRRLWARNVKERRPRYHMVRFLCSLFSHYFADCASNSLRIPRIKTTQLRLRLSWRNGSQTSSMRPLRQLENLLGRTNLLRRLLQNSRRAAVKLPDLQLASGTFPTRPRFLWWTCRSDSRALLIQVSGSGASRGQTSHLYSLAEAAGRS